MRRSTYKVITRDGLHYVFGYVGGGKWMQSSDGMRSKVAAEKAAKRYARAEASAKAELAGWSGASIND